MAKHPVFVKTKQLVIFSLNTAKKNSNQIKTSSRLTYIFFCLFTQDLPHT